MRVWTIVALIAPFCGVACTGSAEDRCDGCGPALDSGLSCGNGTIDPGEDCDPDLVSTATCVALGRDFTGGSLACGPACAFDTSACTAPSYQLGDLAAHASRLPTWPNGSWADTYDTKAELASVHGWSEVAVHAGSCANNVGSGEDEAAIAAAFAANCAAGNCNGKVFQLDGSADTGVCHYNLMAGGGDAIRARYSNFALVGGGRAYTKLFCDNTVSGPDESLGNPCITVSDHWGQGSLGAAYTWSAGLAQGATLITLASCAGLSAPASVELRGTDADGGSVSFQTRMVAVTPSCQVTLEDPLPMTFAAGVALRPWTQRIQNVVLMDLHVGFPIAPRGTQSGEIGSATYGGATIFAHGVEQLLLARVEVGPWAQGGLDTRNVLRLVMKESVIDEGLTSARRGTRTGFMGSPSGSGQYVIVNNAIRRGAPRFFTFEGDSHFNVVAWNYQEAQSAFSPDTGSYCAGITTNDPVFPEHRVANERGLFFHESGTANITAALLEGNDFTCGLVTDGQVKYGRYTTLFRNRFIKRETPLGTSAKIGREGGSSAQWPFLNVWANRASVLAFGSTGYASSLGRWNTFEVQSGVPTDASADWDATNVVDTAPSGPNPAFPALTIPTSLVFKTKPSWWCDEACPFSATDATAPGAGDDRAGPVCKLPAEILLAGTPCTVH